MIKKLELCERLLSEQFTLYGASGHKTISLSELLDLAKTFETVARAENSGSESCYVEVARWNGRKERWQRFAFLKTMDTSLPEYPDASDQEKAIMIAALLDSGGSMIHGLNNFNS